ncbi:Sec-independent protein translocase protein TatB [Brevundimonas bacteroides]|uniref:Sec-independent protein translocase protein TatB n=1 Tax=Brevundimonas bacteroides TaxID=74311 RepID=UPI000494FCF8|nr:Sec-independent protein translocase protein TatB [Brevundimonas bacteroides]
MGGLGPGIGGLEYLIIAVVALIVVGPERLPAMLRQLGKWVAQMRRMANEFRSSFDEMARQSELDELRKEVEALRSGQTVAGQGLVRLGAEADAAFKDIKSELDKPAIAPPPPVTLNSPEFPESAMTPLPADYAAPVAAMPSAAATEATPAAAAPKPRKPRTAKAESTPPAAKTSAKVATKSPAGSRATAKAEPVAAPRPRAPRKPRAVS